MRKSELIIGEVYRIVGSVGGCGLNRNDKCATCDSYPQHLIKVTKKYRGEVKVQGRQMLNLTEEGDGFCSFLPCDLEPTTITNWRVHLQ